MGVDLNPNRREKRPARTRGGARWLNLILAGLVVVALVGGAILWLVLRFDLAGLESDLALAEAESQRYAKIIERADRLAALEAQCEEKRRLALELSGDGVQWNLVMDEFRDMVPQTVVLDGISCLGGPEGTVNVAGRAGSLRTLSQFVVNLEEARYLTAPEVKALVWSRDYSTYVFTLTCLTKGVETDG